MVSCSLYGTRFCRYRGNRRSKKENLNYSANGSFPLPGLPAVLRGRNAFMLAKHFAEVILILITDELRDFTDRQLRMSKQRLGFVHPQLRQITEYRRMISFSKFFGNILGAEMKQVRQ